MEIQLSGPWEYPQIEEYLAATTFPIRLSCVARDGFPRVVSLWYRHEAEKIFCITHQSARLVALLTNNNRVGFEISPDAPPYHGIRGQGSASLQPLGESGIMEDLLSRYTGDLESSFASWLLSRKDEELLITITPHRIFSWDYRQRMAEVV